MDGATILYLTFATILGVLASKIHSELRIIILLALGVALSFAARSIGLILDPSLMLYAAYLFFALLIFQHVPQLRLSFISEEKKAAFQYAASSLLTSLVAGYIAYTLTYEPLFYIMLFSLAMFLSQITYGQRKNFVAHALTFESSASIGLVLSLFFVVADVRVLLSAKEYYVLVEHLLLSLGLGILFGIILLRFASSKRHHNIVSFVVLMLALLISQWLAMAGLAIFTASFLFSGFESARISHTFDFLKKISDYFEILLVIMAGFLFSGRIDADFLMLSLSLYAIFFFMRFFANSFFATSLREKIFLTLNNPKGSPGALLYVLMMLVLPRYETLWNLYFAQVVLSEIVSFLSHRLEDPHAL